jgi:hypothetical protein
VSIKPRVSPGIISIAMIGIRDVLHTLNLFPVKKIFCKFDISGDTKDAVITNKHPVIGGSCNLLEIVSVDIDVPENLEYAPVLTVYVYDNYLGILGSRLLGVTNIPLEDYCKEIMQKKYESSRPGSVKAINADQIKITLDKGIKEELKDADGPFNNPAKSLPSKKLVIDTETDLIQKNLPPPPIELEEHNKSK